MLINCNSYRISSNILDYVQKKNLSWTNDEGYFYLFQFLAYFLKELFQESANVFFKVLRHFSKKHGAALMSETCTES